MFPFERPIRDLVLKGLHDDHETFDPLNDKEMFTVALNRYLQLRTDDRDMYRETLDDLMDSFAKKKVSLRFPPKHRSEGKYYTDYYRKHFNPSRFQLYKQRKWVLHELASYDLLVLPRLWWQPIFMKRADRIKRLRSLIAEFEDRCLQSLGRKLTTRIEYDEVKHQIIEHGPRGSAVLRDLKPDKLPARFVMCMFDQQGKNLTFDQVYKLMGITEKGDRRIARWRKELKLDQSDLMRFFQFLPEDRIIFQPEYRFSDAEV